MTDQVPNTATGTQFEGVTKADLARLEKLISENTQVSQPSSPPEADLDDTVKRELDELAKYRENDRQALLKRLPKKVIKEFKLEEASLAKVKEISTLTQALKKREGGVDTPAVDPAKQEKKYQWNPETGKNEWC